MAIKIIAETLAGVKICEFQNAKNRQFTSFLNSVGEMSFEIPSDDAKFTLISPIKTVLKVVKDGTTIWAGNYDYVIETKDTFTIFASSFERLLDDYLVIPNSSSTTLRSFGADKIGTEIAQVIFNESKGKTNSNLSGFTLGTIENPYTPGTSTEMEIDMEFDYETALVAINTAALAGKADWYIGVDKTFNFLRRRGSDQANIVFRLKNNEPSNILDFNRHRDFRAIGNNVYAFGVGTRVNFISKSTSDATSQTTYGLMERNLGIPKTLVDEDALDKLVKEQIKTLKNPSDQLQPVVRLLSGGIELFSGWGIGDNVKVIISRNNTSVDKYMRVYGVNVSYSDTGAENAFLYLIEKES